MTETCMNWGIETGSGWFDLIDRTCAKIMELDTNKLVQFTQVKEKFGGLRIYFSIQGKEPEWKMQSNGPILEIVPSVDDKVQTILNEAEEESYKICELCGKPGKLYPGGWWITLCPECKQDRDKRKE